MKRAISPKPRQAARQDASMETIEYTTRACALGRVLVAASASAASGSSSPRRLCDTAVCAILLGDAAPGDDLVAQLAARFPAAKLARNDAALHALADAVLHSIHHPGQSCPATLQPRGTAFQRKVWHQLRQIPAGTTASYAEVAAALGMPRAVRAVAGACAANPLAVLIPCHRVVKSDGTLSGYRWGVERKRQLLALEAARATPAAAPAPAGTQSSCLY